MAHVGSWGAFCQMPSGCRITLHNARHMLVSDDYIPGVTFGPLLVERKA